MPITPINVGSTANDGTGDSLRTAGQTINLIIDAVENATVADYTALKALAGGIYSTVWVEDDDRGGMFVWRSGDYSSLAATDVGEGIYVKATDTATSSGIWQRLFDGNNVYAKWWGFIAGAASDYTTIWENMQTALVAGWSLHYPQGNFTFDSQPAALRTVGVKHISAPNWGTILQRNYTPSSGLTGSGSDDVFIELQTTNVSFDLLITAIGGSSGGIGFGCFPNVQAFSVSGVTLSGSDPVRVTVTGHSFLDRGRVSFSGLGGSTELNSGSYYITYIDANTIELDGTSSANVTAWTSGGTCTGNADWGDFSVININVAASSSQWTDCVRLDASRRDTTLDTAIGIRDMVFTSVSFRASGSGFYGYGLVGGVYNVQHFENGVTPTLGIEIDGDATVPNQSIVFHAPAFGGGLSVDRINKSALAIGNCGGNATFGANILSVNATIGKVVGDLTMASPNTNIQVGEVSGTTYLTGAMVGNVQAGKLNAISASSTFTGTAAISASACGNITTAADAGCTGSIYLVTAGTSPSVTKGSGSSAEIVIQSPSGVSSSIPATFEIYPFRNAASTTAAIYQGFYRGSTVKGYFGHADSSDVFQIIGVSGSSVDTVIGAGSGGTRVTDTALSPRADDTVDLGTGTLPFRGLTLHPYTAAEIIDATNAVNTTGKYVGKVIFDSTNRRLLLADGTLSTSVWYVVDGSATVAPS